MKEKKLTRIVASQNERKSCHEFRVMKKEFTLAISSFDLKQWM